MKRLILAIVAAACIVGGKVGMAQDFKAVDIPTRAGVTQRFLYAAPPNARAVVVLFTGGNGALQITETGELRSGAGNFLVRNRQRFAQEGLAVIVVDSPSDRQGGNFLNTFRQTDEHVRDISSVIAWARENAKVPVWLVGTSRGTQSAAWASTRLTGKEGPDGLVLTSTILNDARTRPVPAMDIGKLAIPVLVVHHEQDGCNQCRFHEMPRLMEKLPAGIRKELITYTGGLNVGDPCEPRAYHGFNGLDAEVVHRISEWILAPRT